MRRKGEVTGKRGSGKGRGTVTIPAGYGPEEWLDMSDTMEGEEPDSEEETEAVYAEEEG